MKVYVNYFIGGINTAIAVYAAYVAHLAYTNHDYGWSEIIGTLAILNAASAVFNFTRHAS